MMQVERAEDEGKERGKGEARVSEKLTSKSFTEQNPHNKHRIHTSKNYPESSKKITCKNNNQTSHLKTLEQSRPRNRTYRKIWVG